MTADNDAAATNATTSATATSTGTTTEGAATTTADGTAPSPSASRGDQPPRADDGPAVGGTMNAHVDADASASADLDTAAAAVSPSSRPPTPPPKSALASPTEPAGASDTPKASSRAGVTRSEPVGMAETAAASTSTAAATAPDGTAAALETPAPHRPSTPSAPAKARAPTPVLDATPASPGPRQRDERGDRGARQGDDSTDGATPTTSSTPAASRPSRPPVDIAEFDPYATPAPPPPPPKPKPRLALNTDSRDATPVPSRRAVSGPAASGGDAGAPGPSSASTQGTSTAPGSADASASGSTSGLRQSSALRNTRQGSSDEPTFNFSGFLKDLRSKPADPVARFLTNFAKKPFTVNEQIKLIRDFLAFIAEKMRNVEPWKSQTPAEFDNALEAMEKLVMNRLYPYTFTPQLHEGHPITTDDLERDAVFAQRVRLFGWVQEKHLDVPEGEAAQGFLGFAEQELLKINHYKAPRDKMICILNCCKVIFGLIRHTGGAEAGADAFVPILIYVVLRASPENMLSNVEYIQRFRNPEKLQGEAGYYLSSLQGAIAFIETMDASSLSNITQEEFENNVERAIQELPESPSSPRARSSVSSAADISPFATSPGEEPAQQLALPATAAALDGTKRFFQRTGDAAKEAVSRPLGAITKILENMQQQGYDSESGDDEDGGHVERQWAPGGARDREAEARSSAHHAAGALPMHQGVTSTPQRAEPPSRLLAQLGISPPPSESVTREPTPHPPPPPHYDDGAAGVYASEVAMQNTLEASHVEYAREQARAASVTTLHQMFPALDEEIVDAVLYSCGDDLGLAIDRLLEM